MSAHVHTGHCQTRSMSWSASYFPPVTSTLGPQLMEEQLSDSKQKIEALTESLNAVLAEIDTLHTHCYFANRVISSQQKQLFLRDNKKKHAKKTNNKSRVLTAEEGCQQMQQLQEEAETKEQHRQQELAWKAADDEAR
ncbi:hypothetical protein H4582DRAFT_2062591 [Lactarius indigo]|nr:hypothetical protein H4582DRAFT_2062591 [Lactarius indigo]